MIDYYDLPDSLTFEELADDCEVMSEEEAVDYLSELASAVWPCPDKCDSWACEQYNIMVEMWNQLTIPPLQVDNHLNPILI